MGLLTEHVSGNPGIQQQKAPLQRARNPHETLASQSCKNHLSSTHWRKMTKNVPIWWKPYAKVLDTIFLDIHGRMFLWILFLSPLMPQLAINPQNVLGKKSASFADFFRGLRSFSEMFAICENENLKRKTSFKN